MARPQAWKAVPSTGTTTYIRNDLCKPVQGACAGKFLRCAGYNVAANPIPLRTYDLPATILAQACLVKGCVFFTSASDDSGGTLYQFEAAGANQTGVNGYFLLPA